MSTIVILKYDKTTYRGLKADIQYKRLNFQHYLLSDNYIVQTLDDLNTRE